MTAPERVLVRADVVYNGLGTPRRYAAVLVERDADRARIVAVDDVAGLRSAYPEARELDAGWAIAPAPINAHTHLDLSTMPLVDAAYETFVREVVAFGRSGRRGVDAMRAGMDELRDAGVHTIGDIVTTEDGMRFLLEQPNLKGVAYWEVFGPDPADAERMFAETVERLRRFKAWERPGGVRVGVSPHAAHTVSAPLLRRLAELARGNELPMQIHLAESPGEAELFANGRGPLADLLRGMGVPLPTSGTTPVRYVERLGVLDARPTLVHMTEVDEEDVRRVQRADCTVVHCPRSNMQLGSRRFPWELFARYGASVAIGTDSRGSSPSLSPLDEAHAAFDLHGNRAAPVALVRAIVKGGSRVLGLRPPIVKRGAPADALTAWTAAGAVDLDVYTAQHTAPTDVT